MPNANHLINALAADDKDEANSAFESAIQDKMSDYLEVRKVELASSIMDDIQEGALTNKYDTLAKPLHVPPKDVSVMQSIQTRVALKAKKLGTSERRLWNKMRLNNKSKRLQGEEAIVEGGPTRKHFQQTADLIKQIEHPEKRKEMANHHASLFAQQNPRFDKAKFMSAAGVNEALEGGSKSAAAAPSNAQLNRNVMANIRKAVTALGVKGVNPSNAAAGHRDFSKLVAKNPKAPGYMLLRKLAPAKAQAVQSLTQAGVPLGGSLEANPNEFNQVVQRIKRFK